jgi:hypothetical protein
MRDGPFIRSTTVGRKQRTKAQQHQRSHQKAEHNTSKQCNCTGGLDVTHQTLIIVSICDTNFRPFGAVALVMIVLLKFIQ